MSKMLTASMFFVIALLSGCANNGMMMRQPMQQGQYIQSGQVITSGQQALPDDCVPAPQVMGQPAKCWDGRIIGRQQHRQIIQQQQGNSSGIGKCEIVGGLVGAGTGALVGGKNHRGIGALIGGIIGMFAGNEYCEDQYGQTVPMEQYRQQTQQVQVQQQQVRQVRTEAVCNISRNAGGVREEKKVSNPSLSEEYCKISLPALLRSGQIRWEDL